MTARILLAAFLIPLLTSSSEACRFCGRSVCVLSHKQVAIQTAPAYPQPTVNVVVNGFPAADQGNTVYSRGLSFNSLSESYINNGAVLAETSARASDLASQALLNAAAQQAADRDLLNTLAKAQVAVEALRALNSGNTTQQVGGSIVSGSNQPAIASQAQPAQGDRLNLLVSTSCAKCHTGAQAKAQFDLNQPGLRDRPEALTKMLDRVTSKDPKLRMPPNSPSVNHELAAELARRLLDLPKP